MRFDLDTDSVPCFTDCHDCSLAAAVVVVVVDDGSGGDGGGGVTPDMAEVWMVVLGQLSAGLLI